MRVEDKKLVGFIIKSNIMRDLNWIKLKINKVSVIANYVPIENGVVTDVVAVSYDV